MLISCRSQAEAALERVFNDPTKILPSSRIGAWARSPIGATARGPLTGESARWQQDGHLTEVRDCAHPRGVRSQLGAGLVSRGDAENAKKK